MKSELGPELAVIFLSGARTESYDRVAGLLLGGDDYVVKPSAPDEVLARVRIAVDRVRPARAAAHGRLTRREHEVLALLGEGLKWGEIARRLVISPRTVATHAENIRRKLGVNSRAEAIAVAYRDELLPPPVPRPVP
jgi:DNA-binding NarL/FixJ family response regulator